MYFIFCSFGENKFIMVNWQFYGEDKKQNTPPQSPLPPKQERSKFKWTGIPIVILIGVGMMKFIGGEIKNNPTNSFIKEPVLHISPVNFVPTNNDYIQKTSPKLKSTMPESDFKSFQQYYGNQNLDTLFNPFNIPITNGLLGVHPSQILIPNKVPQLVQDSMKKSLLNPDNNINLLNTKIKTDFKHNRGLDIDNSINSSFPKIKTDIILDNSILNQQNSFDSKTKIKGSLD
jgi:hypothetical protein